MMLLEPWIQKEQCGFHPGCEALDTIRQDKIRNTLFIPHLEFSLGIGIWPTSLHVSLGHPVRSIGYRFHVEGFLVPVQLQ